MVQFSSFQSGSDRSGPVRIGSVRFRFGSVWFSSVLFDLMVEPSTNWSVGLEELPDKHMCSLSWLCVLFGVVCLRIACVSWFGFAICVYVCMRVCVSWCCVCKLCVDFGYCLGDQVGCLDHVSEFGVAFCRVLIWGVFILCHTGFSVAPQCILWWSDLLHPHILCVVDMYLDTLREFCYLLRMMHSIIFNVIWYGPSDLHWNYVCGHMLLYIVEFTFGHFLDCCCCCCPVHFRTLEFSFEYPGLICGAGGQLLTMWSNTGYKRATRYHLFGFWRSPGYPKRCIGTLPYSINIFVSFLLVGR